jgi:hypothetical protein
MASRKRKGVGQALPGKRARLDDEDRFQAWINSYPKVRMMIEHGVGSL